MGLEFGDLTDGPVIILPGDEARFCMPGGRGVGMCMGDDMGRGFIILTGLLLGERASASRVYDVSTTLLGVGDLLGLSTEPSPLPFSL